MDFYSNLPATAAPVETTIYPTLFEILSSIEIDDLLTPSVRYIVANLVARNPNRYTIKISNWFDEWFTLVTKFTLEYHHLKYWNATFIEKFYGLKRINAKNKLLLRVLKQSPSADLPLSLTKTQRGVVLVEKVIAPYVTLKLDLQHSKLLASSLFRPHDNHVDSENQNTSKRTRLIAFLRRIFLQYYPSFKKIMFAANLAIKLYFLSGKIGSTTLLDYMFNIEHTRLTQHDYKRNTTGSTSRQKKFIDRPKRTNIPMLQHYAKLWVSNAAKLLQYSGSQLFPAFIFMLRVFQWWSAQDLSGKIQRKLEDIDKDIPPPPPPQMPYQNSEYSNCFICHDLIQNPAAIETGYVFCYPCILKYLPENEGRCPITGNRLLGCEFDQDSGKWTITGIRKLLL